MAPQLTEATKGQMIGMWQVGRSFRYIAGHFQVSLQTVSTWINRLSVSNISETDCFMFSRVMHLLKSFFRCNEDGEFYSRLFFVGIALHAVRHRVKEDYNEAENFINCLRMYFSVTSNLCLTIFDVRSVLYGCFLLLNKLDLFDKYSQEFDNLMPECPSTVQPRKLSHLARCQVRKNLKVAKLPLHSATEQLHLPQIVKKFILGNMFDLPSRNGNASDKNAVTKGELERLFSGIAY